MHRNEDREWSNQLERAGRSSGFNPDLACRPIRFNFPLQTTVIVPKSHMVSISNSDAKTWKSKSHFSYSKTHLNARYEKDLQQPHIFLDQCYSLGLRALGHPKLLWTFTFRECIWPLWDIHMSNFQCISYENQISCTDIRERHVPGALWTTLWRYLYLSTVYGFLSLIIHTNCAWTSSSVPPFYENLSISTPHSDLVKLDAKVMLIHCNIRGIQHHKSKTDNPWRATDGQAFMNGLPFAPCTERKLGWLWT